MILESLLELRDSWSARHPSEHGNWDWMGDEPSATGMAVTPFTALANTPFYQGVELISSMPAVLPLITHRRNGAGGVDRDRETGLYNLLRYEPNPEATAFTHLRAQLLNKLLWGDSYAEIERDRTGRPVHLWHLPSWLVTPYRVYKKSGGGLTTILTSATPEDRKRGGTIMYEVKDGHGGKPVWLPPSEMFHVPGLSFNGLRGFSCLYVAKEAVAMGLAMQKSGAAIMGNAARPGAILERPADAALMTPSGERNLIAAFEAYHGGVKKIGRTAVLQEGTSYKAVDINLKELQYAESVKNDVPQVARILNISPYFLGHDGSQNTYTNVEGEWIRLQRQTLMPHTTAIEQEIQRKLIFEDDAESVYAEFEYKGLLRGDSAARGTFYQVLRGIGAITPAEVARLENLPAVPEDQGGNDFRAPVAPPAPPFGAAAPPKKKPAQADEPAKDEEDDETRQARFRNGLEGMLAAALQRVVTRETKQIRQQLRASTDLTALRGTLVAFYDDELRPYIAEVAQPALGKGAATFARRFAESHESALRDRIELGKPEGVVDLLESWTATAAAEAAAEEINRLAANATN